MSKQYEKGRAFEYEIIDRIKELSPDAHAGRNAGSHGWFDVWAIVPDPFDPSKGNLHLIQAKTQKGKKPTKENREAWEKMKLIEIPKILIPKKEFWIKIKGHIIAWGE